MLKRYCFIFLVIPLLWACDISKEEQFYQGSGTWNVVHYSRKTLSTGEEISGNDAGFIMFLESSGDLFITDPEGNYLDSYKGLIHLKIPVGNGFWEYNSGFDYVMYEEVLNVFYGANQAIYKIEKTGGFMKLTFVNSYMREEITLSNVSFSGPMPDYL